MINKLVDFSIPSLLLANINKKNTKFPKRHGFFMLTTHFFQKETFKHAVRKPETTFKRKS